MVDHTVSAADAPGAQNASTSPSSPTSPAGAVTAQPPDGQARRRARTRDAMLGAGRALLSEGREDASIEEITRRAGVGFGSFSNHFPEGKQAFFHRAALEVLAQVGEQIGRLTAEQSDPVDALAVGLRTTAHLARQQTGLRAILLRPGTDILFAADTLLAAARHDIDRGIAGGQFTQADGDLLLVAVGSVLLGTLRLLDARDQHSAPDAGSAVPKSEDTLIDEAAACALRLLGVDGERARAAANAPLPPLDLGSTQQ